MLKLQITYYQLQIIIISLKEEQSNAQASLFEHFGICF